MKRLAVLAFAAGVLLTGGMSAAASTTSLNGVFETTIKGKGTQLDGKWLISFAPNGAYAVAKEPSNNLLIGGTSAVSKHTVAFADKVGPIACTGPQAHAIYSWSLDGKTLKLKVVKDTCVGRALILSSAPSMKARRDRESRRTSRR